MTEIIALLIGLVVGLLVGFKVDNWFRDAWAQTMSKRLTERNAEVKALKDDNETLKGLCDDALKQLKDRREWPEIVG